MAFFVVDVYQLLPATGLHEQLSQRTNRGQVVGFDLEQTLVRFDGLVYVVQLLVPERPYLVEQKHFLVAVVREGQLLFIHIDQ